MTDSRTRLALALGALAAALSWSGCSSGSSDGCTPVAEACNGVDDDCDGEVDEGFDLGAACTSGVGACAASGVRVCLAGVAACDAVPGEPAASETCDQVDEDCDGQTDEDVPGCCTPAATRPCGSDAGACTAGTETCSAQGAWGECLGAGGDPVVLPGVDAETCNGIDDDCDGETDEEAVAPGCPLQAGVCAGATQACDGANGWICTYPAAFEEVEGACDGLDNDCDGETDEGFPVGSGCSAGVGACARAGTLVCTPDAPGARCDAIAGEPGPESCNGLDDDCDGATDESVTDPTAGTACDGSDDDLCNEGVIVCSGGALQCTDVSGTNVETCNGVDDDCDGQTDESVTDPAVGTPCDGSDGDLCREGVIACSDGALQCTDASGTNVETCNGVDDDCNGATDESWPEIGTACTAGIGACARSGQRLCKVDGTGTECSAVPGTPAPAESCNGVDDDCDGQTDEELASALLCAKQAGVCAGARSACGGVEGWLPCDDATYLAYAPVYEPDETRCDALDNDCDGAKDEGLSGCSP